MELAEPIERINKQLIDYFGTDTVTGDAIWRVVWSNDQYEKRLSEFTPEGLQLLYPQIQNLRKYPQSKDRWILERLVLVPETNIEELAGAKQSYEPMWVFEDNKGNYLPPKFIACKAVVDTVYAALGKKSMRKYVDDKNTPEARKKRLDEYEEALFGDESELAYRTVTGEAVAYTGEPKIKEGQ